MNESGMQAKFKQSLLVGITLTALIASGAAMARSPVSTAQPGKGISASFTTCQERAQGAIAQAACISQETELEDQRLNRVDKELQGKRDAAGKAKLVGAQRAWLESRKRDGELETVIFDSTQPGNLQGSEIEMRRLGARADQLQGYIDLLD